MSKTKPKIHVYKPFPITDPVALAAHLAKLEGSLVGLTRLTLTEVAGPEIIGYPGIDKGPHIRFTFAEAA